MILIAKNYKDIAYKFENLNFRNSSVAAEF